MRRLLLICLVLFAVIVLKSCYYDVEEELYKPSNCEITGVSYSLNIFPVISDNCYSCHSEANKSSGANIVLEGYTNLKITVDDGKLLCSIKQLSCATSPMPKGAPQLRACPIAQIEAWIADGSPNN